MTPTEINMAICKTLGIDTLNVQRVVVLLEPMQPPRIRITRFLLGTLVPPYQHTESYELVSRSEKPIVPLSIADTVDALQGFEVSESGDASSMDEGSVIPSTVGAGKKSKITNT